MQKEGERMLSQNPFLKFSTRSNEHLKSAILNCICPECGGALSLAANQFRCLGRLSTDWRPVWIRDCRSRASECGHLLKAAASKCVSRLVACKITRPRNQSGIQSQHDL